MRTPFNIVATGRHCTRLLSTGPALTGPTVRRALGIHRGVKAITLQAYLAPLLV